MIALLTFIGLSLGATPKIMFLTVPVGIFLDVYLISLVPKLFLEKR